MGILPIGFFAPLPLAIMIPFMAAQSFAMGHAFGTSFQYGKRKISSLTNEEFNALSATDLHGELQADIRDMIPNMNQSFKRMETFQIDIINSMVNTLKIAAVQFFEWITTGKVPSGGGLQTDTSATNIDFTGGVFDIQGGSRQDNALTSDNPNSNLFKNAAGETYEEWLVSSGLGAQATATKAVSIAAQARIDRDIQKSKDAAKLATRALAPKITTVRSPTDSRQFKTVAQHAVTKAKNKLILLKNLKTLKARAKLANLEYNRFKKGTQRDRTPRVGLTKATMDRHIRGLRILLNIRKDANQKVTNAERILRNFR